MQLACVVNVLCVCEIMCQRRYVILPCTISLSENSEQRAAKMATPANYFDEEEEEDPYQTDDDKDSNYSPPEAQKKTKKKDSEKNSATKPVSKPKEKKIKKYVATFDEKRKFAGFLEKEQLIWDLKHKLHANHYAQTAAWDRLSLKMNKTGNFLHSHIRVTLSYLTYYALF